MVFFFFFKQKTSYEMRISDWSSDVCSSDLPGGGKERPMTIRTFLVDDHALVRTGIRMILSGAVDIDIIGEAESGEQALPQIRELKPDVVVCDMHLPGISGLEVPERIMKGAYGEIVIAHVLTPVTTAQLVYRLLKVLTNDFPKRSYSELRRDP